MRQGGCPANYSVTATWAATDASGNMATLSQTATFGDSTPPYLKPECAAKHFCLSQTTDGTSTFCLPASQLLADCFADDCSRVTGLKLECGGCSKLETNSSYPGPQTVSLACRPRTVVDDTGAAAGEQLCFTVSGMPAPGAPVCCEGRATVTDECGNTAVVAFPKVCAYHPKSLPASDECFRLP